MPKRVTLSFSGLMLFHFKPNPTECRVGIHTNAPGHQVTVKVNGSLERAYSHEHLKSYKHLWLYAAASKDSLTPINKPVTKRGAGSPSNVQSYDHVVSLDRFYKQRLLPKWDIFSPSLHILGGDYYTKELSANCRLVEIQALENIYYSFFQPHAADILTRFDGAKAIYNQYPDPFKTAKTIGVDFNFGDTEWLVLALGNEAIPQYSLFSTQPSDGLELTINNLPPPNAIFGGNPVEHDVEHDHAAHMHSTDSLLPNPPEPVGTQIRNRLPRLFHFLHYYRALSFNDARRFILLEQQDNLDKHLHIFGPKPDPPCNCITCDEPPASNATTT